VSAGWRGGCGFSEFGPRLDEVVSGNRDINLFSFGVIVEFSEVPMLPYEGVSRLVSESDLLPGDLKDSSFKASLGSVSDNDSVTWLEIVLVRWRSC
jgi:hypothetical protein